jgi:hypothetical protein
LWDNNGQILSALEKNLTTNKKISKCGFDDIDKALLAWFKVQRDAGFPINDPILKIQAEKFAMQLEHYDCSYSNGWFDRFKYRHIIVYAQISGEALSADTKTASEWVKSVWEERKKGYTKEEIYNADETGLLYNMTPNTTFKFKGESVLVAKN